MIPLTCVMEVIVLFSVVFQAKSICTLGYMDVHLVCGLAMQSVWDLYTVVKNVVFLLMFIETINFIQIAIKRIAE